MHIDKSDLEDFKSIMLDENERSLTDKEAEKEAQYLLRFVEIILSTHGHEYETKGIQTFSQE